MQNRTKTADNITLLLLPRFITFIFLFGGSIYLVKSNRFLWELLALYGAAAIAYLSLLLLRKNTARAALRRILISHIILEVVISGVMVFHSGGHRSPLILLFILSIASASMVYQMRGAMFVSLSASISYLISIYFFLENFYRADNTYSFMRVLSHNSDIYFPVSLHVVLFTLVGLIAGYVSERLRERGVLLQTTEEELKRARRFTSDILESMGSGLICIDYSCEIILINRTAREILGINTPRSNETTVKDYLRDGYEPLAVFLETAAVENRNFDQYEVVVTRGDGIRAPLAVSTSRLSTPDEKPVGVIAVFQDLTEAKKLQHKLRIYDRLAAVGQLSAGIAHEIRNPLTSISGSVEVLQNELDLNPTNRKLMEVVIKESQRLNRILTEFLDYARIKPTMFANIELSKLTDEVVEFISNDKRFESGIEIFNTLTADITAVGDEEKIRQILINLILNAIDAVNSSEGRITIGKALESGRQRYIVTGDFDRPVRLTNEHDREKYIFSANYVALSVMDNGRGITADKIEKVFHPFYSTKQGGTGLGLAIVQRLVESIDGVLVFETGPGKGTVFTVFLRAKMPSNVSQQLWREETEADESSTIPVM